MTGNALEQRARELLAAEYAKRGYQSYEKLALSGNGEFTLCSIRAIEAALRLSAWADWVSVADRLPDLGEHVEVWPDPRDDTYTFYAHCDGGTNGVKAGHWYYNDRHGDYYVIGVTHWRQRTTGPLPAAPRHETGEGL